MWSYKHLRSADYQPTSLKKHVHFGEVWTLENPPCTTSAFLPHPFLLMWWVLSLIYTMHHGCVWIFIATLFFNLHFILITYITSYLPGNLWVVGTLQHLWKKPYRARNVTGETIIWLSNTPERYQKLNPFNNGPKTHCHPLTSGSFLQREFKCRSKRLFSPSWTPSWTCWFWWVTPWLYLCL